MGRLNVLLQTTPNLLPPAICTHPNPKDCWGDYSTLCIHQANAGECQKNPDYMLYNCAKSCHQDIPDSFYDIQAEDIDGNMIDFNFFRQRVVYIVNVASEVRSHCTLSLYSFQCSALFCCIHFGVIVHKFIFSPTLFSDVVRIHCSELSITPPIKWIS